MRINSWDNYRPSLDRTIELPYMGSIELDSMVGDGDIVGGKFSQFSQVNAGSGDKIAILSGVHKTYRIWAGKKNPNSAPFRVDKDGNVTMTSATITGYIPTGGAADDVNTHTTTINGDKITTGTLDANRIKTSTLTATVDVGSGTGFVKLDGGNNRILIHDGTNNRIVIGNV